MTDSNNNNNNKQKVTTLIFDVDDTLYDVGTGFTGHRNGEAVQRFMMEYLNFPDLESAKKIRDEFFERTHATAKALTVAEQEGRLPLPDPSSSKPLKSPRFDPKDLAAYWAANLNFDLLGGPKLQVLQDFKDLQSQGQLKLVAFSNGPRAYVIRVLQALGLWEIFGEDRLFAVDDVLPHCKPEKKAFEKVFNAIGVTAEECILFEDSMKNIRRAKELGVQTVLITGAGRMRKSRVGNGNGNGAAAAAAAAANSLADQVEATKPGDAPVEDDPAVDVAIETIEEMRAAMPGLWKTPAIFTPTKR